MRGGDCRKFCFQFNSLKKGEERLEMTNEWAEWLTCNRGPHLVLCTTLSSMSFFFFFDQKPEYLAKIEVMFSSVTADFSTVSSVAQYCPTLCNPMDCSTPCLPVHHQFLELAQTHDHWVGDAIQPSHPLLSPSSPGFNLSQHQGLLQWVSSSH